MKRVLLTFLILVFVTCGFKCSKSQKNMLAVIGMPQNLKAVQSPLGATVATISGNVSPLELSTIDNSLQTLFADSRALGYQTWLDEKQYTVIIKEDCTPAPISKTMAFKVYGSYPAPWGMVEPGTNKQYVLAAEMVMKDANDNPIGAYVICRDSIDTMAQTARFGAEHIILFNNDKANYERTKIHTDASNSHPIIPSKK